MDSSATGSSPKSGTPVPVTFKCDDPEATVASAIQAAMTTSTLPATATFSGTFSSGSTTVTVALGVSSIVVGSSLSGTGIATGTVITATNTATNTVTLSIATTQAATATLTYTYGKGVTVIRSIPAGSTDSYTYTIGYADAINPTSTKTQSNWYQPQLVSPTTGVTTTVTTLQEGGQTYQFPGASSKTSMAAKVAIWIKKLPSVSLQLQFTVTVSSTVYTYPTAVPSTASNYTTATQLQTDIRALGNAAGDSACLGLATVSTKASSSTYDYFEISYPSSSSCTKDPQTQMLSLLNNGASIYSGGANTNVFMSVLQNYNNAPWFYSAVMGMGALYTGAWTCYMRDSGYIPWTIYSGNVNSGVISAVATTAYAVGYSVAGDADRYGVQKADMTNKAGTVVTSSYTSVAYAVMELGGNFDAWNTASLLDGDSSLVWPLAGYTYLVIHRTKHIGDCTRRTAAMEYLWTFYHSSIATEIANKNGFSTLPDFIRDIVVQKMVSEIKCSDGSLALKAHVRSSAPIATSSVFAQNLGTYITVYRSIDSSAQFQAVTYPTSEQAWSVFSAAPDSYASAFTIFPSTASKASHYGGSVGYVSTVPFAHYPVVPIYHLDEFTSSACNTASSLTSSQSSLIRLRLTPAILAGIYTGAVKFWDDALIKAANPLKASLSCLPHTSIKVVGLAKEADSNVIWSRFLSLSSSAFQAMYNVPADGTTLISFVGLTEALASQSLWRPKSQGVYDNTVNSAMSNWVLSYIVNKNLLVDTAVTTFNYAIGYYDPFADGAPQASYAQFCASSPGDCSNLLEPVDPSLQGSALSACEDDPSTAVGGTNWNSFDFMLSKAPGCYPISATVDQSIYSKPGAPACAVAVNSASASASGVESSNYALARVKFSAWLSNGTTIGAPLRSLYNSIVTSDASRDKSKAQFCDISCGVQPGEKNLGYAVCGYRDCAWDSGDFLQIVDEECDAKTSTRTAKYALKPESTCYGSRSLQSVVIPCVYADSSSALGVIAYVMAAVGIVMSVTFGATIYFFRRTRTIRRSQPIFVFISTFGTFLLNLVIIAFVGKNTDRACMLRPWAFNIAATIMFAPLVMKLHRVDTIFRNPSLKRIKVTDLTVFLQVCALIGVDVVLLILWSAVPSETPRLDVSNVSYVGVLDSVQDGNCSTTLESSVFEKLVLAWKAALIIFGVSKAALTWNVPEDFSVAKQFALAIYNITACGGVCYFLAVFLQNSQQGSVAAFLRCVGVFLGCNAACAVIMVPKLNLVYAEITEYLQSQQKLQEAGAAHCVSGRKMSVSVVHQFVRALDDIDADKTKSRRPSMDRTSITFTGTATGTGTGAGAVSGARTGSYIAEESETELQDSPEVKMKPRLVFSPPASSAAVIAAP